MKKMLAIQTCRSARLVDWLINFYKTSTKRHNHTHQTLDQIENAIKNEFLNLKKNYDYIFIEISGTRFIQQKLNKQQFLEWYERVLKIIPINSKIIIMGPSNVLLTDSHVNTIINNKKMQSNIVKRESGLRESLNNDLIQNKRLVTRVNVENWLQERVSTHNIIFLKLSDCFTGKNSSQVFKSSTNVVDTFHYKAWIHDILIKYTNTKLNDNITQT